MKLLKAILVPLDGSEVALRSLGCAAWLASRTGARLHVLNAGPASTTEALGVPEHYRSLIELHQTSGAAEGDILGAVTRYAIDLIVMTARGQSAEASDEPSKLIGHVTRGVIEGSPVPVLMLPPAYEESLPWRSALVPISGEPSTDQSLLVALRFADALDLSVTVAHVVDHEGAEAARQLYSDAAHHAYPQILQEFIGRACPMCSAEERRHIVDFRLCHGDIAQELLRLIEQKHVELLISGWHGQFFVGHAQILKALVEQLHCAVLLVKAAPRRPFSLKVGAALSGAGP